MAERPARVEITIENSMSESDLDVPAAPHERLSTQSASPLLPSYDKARLERARLFTSEVNTAASTSTALPQPEFKGSRRPGVRSASASPEPIRNGVISAHSANKSHGHHHKHKIHHHHQRKRSKSFDLHDKVRSSLALFLFLSVFVPVALRLLISFAIQQKVLQPKAIVKEMLEYIAKPENCLRFFEFVKGQHSEENLEFYLEVTDPIHPPFSFRASENRLCNLVY